MNPPPVFVTERKRLSDGSMAYDVVFVAPDGAHVVIFDAPDEIQAEKFRSTLNNPEA